MTCRGGPLDGQEPPPELIDGWTGAFAYPYGWYYATSDGDYRWGGESGHYIPSDHVRYLEKTGQLP